MKNKLMFFFFCLCLLMIYGCALLEATGEVVGVVGKVGWEAAKAVGNVAYTGTSMAGQTANGASKKMSSTSYASRDSGITVPGARTVVRLELEGKSYFVRVKFNDKVSGRLLLDTGASAVQISRSMAKRLSVSKKKSQAIPVTLAGGAVVAGRMVTLYKVPIGEMAARNVKVIILDYEENQASDGLLGMSFLENFIFQIDTRKKQLILEKR
jgi:clan AA aspartic protease (TIGR02281 family)